MDWQLALVQHPMFLLIKEDTQCAERTPPWGAPSLEIYIDRVRDNMQRLRKYPQIKIGFEWSGLEVEMLAAEAPDVFTEMVALAKEGRIAFYNGTYAQPHLQICSPEANIRQFQFGMRVYRDLCQATVSVYAHQETSVHDQSPQIMKAFGMKYSALPQFPSTVEYLDGGEIVMRLQRPHFMNGQEFVSWVGLDGSQLPLYLPPVLRNISDWVPEQTMYGLMGEPPIMLEIPDLVEVNDEWLAERRLTEMVLLDQAFSARIQQAPPRAHVRHFTYWSYIEGIRAEELSRSNWAAETAALRAEALNAMALTLVKRPAESTEPVWKTILTTQHHDVYCFCAPELRGKAIGWLHDAETAAQQMSASAAAAISSQVDTSAQAGTPVIVFNTIPHAQTALVELAAPAGQTQVVDASGTPLPSEMEGASVRFLASASGFGYDTYWLRAGGAANQESTLMGAFTFENSFYRAVVQPDGAFRSLILKPSGAELLAKPGNHLTATDSTGISPHVSPGLDNRDEWALPTPGPELTWKPTAAARLSTSPLGATVSVQGEMAANVKSTLTIRFYHAFQRIDLSYDFDFDAASVGIFYMDETKLRVRWPLAFEGKIAHDIAFGVVETYQGRPIHPNTWLDISDGEKGLAYFHQGTFKHWVKDNVLTNLFGWGEATNSIGSRMWRHDWSKCFDQSLNGQQSIHTALYPHAGDWRDANVIAAARSYNAPPVGYVVGQGSGVLPASANLLTITNPEIGATNIQASGAQVNVRLYSFADDTRMVDIETNGLKRVSLDTLAGEPISDLKPFQIANVTLKPE